jgi:hypothetical protein
MAVVVVVVVYYYVYNIDNRWNNHVFFLCFVIEKYIIYELLYNLFLLFFWCSNEKE